MSTLKKKLSFFISILFIFFIIYISALNLNYDWNWNGVAEYFIYYDDTEVKPGVFIYGLAITIKIAIIAFFISLLLGLLFVSLGRSNSLLSKITSLFYIEIIRNTPVLVQIYILYYIIAPIYEWDRFITTCIGLGIFEGAYVAEIFRSGLNSIKKGQWDAAKSLNLPKIIMYTKVIIPQLLTIIFPAITNVLINMLKNSSIASVIAVADLVTEARNAISDTFLTFEIWIPVAFVYLFLAIIFAYIMKKVERLLKKGNFTNE